jgi:hypothetical protein
LGSMITAAVEWGPVAAWAGAVATMLVVITTALVALGVFASVRGPRIRLTFEATEPWCRRGRLRGKARHYGFVSESRTGDAARPWAVLGA